MACCTPTQSCSSALPETCEALPTTNSAVRVVVEDEQSCKRTLPTATNPSLLQQNEDGTVSLNDGSAGAPVNLPSLQEQEGAVPKLIGQNADGDVVGVEGTAAPAEDELFKWDGTQFVPVEISKQFGTGSGVLLRDSDAPNLAAWSAPIAGQVLLGNADGKAEWGNSPVVTAMTPGGRLTLSSETPVLVGSVTTASVLYYTPYTTNQISIYNGTIWELRTFPEISYSIAALAADTNFDIFIYDDAGTLKLNATAWTNNTTRATPLIRVDGVLVKSGDETKRYLGTIRTTGTIGQCEFSFGGISAGGTEAKMFVWNAYNRVGFSMFSGDSTNTWTYGTVAWRSANNSSTLFHHVVVGLQESILESDYNCIVYCPAGSTAAIGIGYDAAIGYLTGSSAYVGSAQPTSTFSTINLVPTVGYHYIHPLETLYLNAGGAATFVGDLGNPDVAQTGFRTALLM